MAITMTSAIRPVYAEGNHFADSLKQSWNRLCCGFPGAIRTATGTWEFHRRQQASLKCALLLPQQAAASQIF